MKKILITGARGQLGKKLAEILTADFELVLTDSGEMDITDRQAVESIITKEKPDFVIHAAAYTKVDDAETERQLAYRINADGSKNLAEVTGSLNIPIIYISTDYVFPGTKNQPLSEDDPTEPVNYYGQTKLDGENFIKQLNRKHYIIRTAWLYGELPKDHPGSNFVETMLKLAKEKPELKVVDDQFGAPTYTGDLVLAIREIIKKNIPYGIYHFSGEGITSWYDFAREIFKQSGINIKITPTTSDNFPRPAKRPTYSYLSKDKLKKAGVPVRPWQDGLREYLKNRE
jgi:dTDP-4-dehydrorhamnose reductase